MGFRGIHSCTRTLNTAGARLGRSRLTGTKAGVKFLPEKKKKKKKNWPPGFPVQCRKKLRERVRYGGSEWKEIEGGREKERE